MDKRFLKAFLTPSRTLLCGYRLFPWCLKHRLWLTALDHPILRGSPCRPEELVFFAKVCAEKPPDRVTLWDRWQTARLKDDVTLHLELVKAHDHLRVETWPRFWDKAETSESGGTSRNRGMPWALGILTNLTKAGIDLETAMNLPECQAIWLSTAVSIQSGAKLDILTSEDEALLDELQRVKDPSPPSRE